MSELTRLTDIRIEYEDDIVDLQKTAVLAVLVREADGSVTRDVHMLGVGIESFEDAAVRLQKQLQSNAIDVCDSEPDWVQFVVPAARGDCEYDTFEVA